jgi:hypothetical protein
MQTTTLATPVVEWLLQIVYRTARRSQLLLSARNLEPQTRPIRSRSVVQMPRYIAEIVEIGLKDRKAGKCSPLTWSGFRWNRLSRRTRP